ncbi:hypothetical protein V8E52_007949 [Russula decolorans]
MISAGVIDSKSLSSVIAGMDWSACRDRLVAGRRIASGWAEGGSPADGQSASRPSTDSTQESPAGWRPMGRSQVILNPKEKMRYFKKHWSPELQDDVVECVEKVFKEQYLSLSGGSTATQSVQPKTNKKLNVLLRELSDDEEMITEVGTGVPEDPKRPWLTDFHKLYKNFHAKDEVLEVDDDSMSTGGSASESTSTVTSWLALLGSEGLTRTDCCCEGTVRIPFS